VVNYASIILFLPSFCKPGSLIGLIRKSCSPFAVLLICISGLAQARGELISSKAVLDLVDWDDERGIIPLAGNWEFFWERLLLPADFNQEITSEKSIYVYVPNVWNAYELGDRENKGHGFATYRLTVVSANPSRSYGLKIPNTISSYKIWIDGKLLSSCGVVAETKEAMTPQYCADAMHFTPAKEAFDIIVQVSNFHHRKGGFIRAAEFGYSEQIIAKRESKLIYEVFLLGAILIISLYHYLLYAFRRKEKTYIYFANVCLAVVVRIMSTGEVLLEHWIPNIPWVIVHFLDYSSAFLGIGYAAAFIYRLYTDEFKKLYARIMLYTMWGFTLFAMVTPPSISSYIIWPFQATAVIVTSYIISVTIRAVINRRPQSIIVLAGAIFVLVVTVNDILFANQLIDTGWWLPYGLMIFIFVQSLVLSIRFADSFRHINLLQLTFRKFVPSRFLDRIAKEGIGSIRVGSAEVETIAVLFSDIRGFTSLSEKNEPERNPKIP